MRFLRLLVAALAVASATLAASSAQAQVVTPGSPTWSAKASSDLRLDQINQADCLLDNATISFDLDITGADSSQVLEVWSGTGCADKTSRDENTNCIKVADGDADSGEVQVLVKDILQDAGIEGAGKGTGTAETCTPDTSASGTTSRVLFFLVLDPGNNMSAGTPGQWPFTFDLVAPPPPTDIVAGPGENALTLNFTESDEDDLKGYRFYCSDVANETAAGGTSSTSGDGSCTSSVLIEGNSPLGLKSCGSTRSKLSTSGETDDSLVNGTNYAVAIAAEDNLGNLGVLSAIACGVPQEVTGYFEAYRAAGGQAGGGFCSFAVARRGALPMALALLFGLAAIARRRK
jgi:hypothetical protein